MLSPQDLTRAWVEPLFARADEIAQATPSATLTGYVQSSGNRGALVERALTTGYCIRRAKGTLNGLRIALLGNLKFSEDAQTLARVLGLYDVRLSFVSPAALSMPYDLSDELRAAGLEIEETNDLETTLRKTDVLYLSRIDPARVEKKVYDKTKDFYKISPALLPEAKPGLFVLGEWDGADELLETARPCVAEASLALQAALKG